MVERRSMPEKVKLRDATGGKYMSRNLRPQWEVNVESLFAMAHRS